MQQNDLSFLLNDSFLNLDMLEAIRHNSAKVFHAGVEGVFIQEICSSEYMISTNNYHLAEEWIEMIPQNTNIVVHQKQIVELIEKKFSPSMILECFQCIYEKNHPIVLGKHDLILKNLEKSYISLIMEHYDTLSEHEVNRIMEKGNMYGGFSNGVLVGFAGIHLKGAIGLLQIFPEHRRKHYAEIIQSNLTNIALAKQIIPFVEIETTNYPSLKLHEKLGFTLTNKPIFVCFYHKHAA